ncbi:hypothetical protein CHS0354_042240 [Potamilus streckersoni]|uniref:Mothers against decapentaplegic homolog n=1 Tax=Potamilus streckersoni TaxID=2493646 RepID=A0AAE0W2C7_9BIVA|nr:hypothetical protein CHS0354_042240 [Potamilus streckersoni]
MFRSKRSGLVKRLWKLRILQNEEWGADESPEELELKSVAQSMLKRLKERQLDVLIQIIEQRGGEATECVLLPKGDLRLGRRSVAPHILCCRLWRWPSLSNNSELKQLSCCSTVNDLAYVCCNPYHWSLLMKPDLPIPKGGWTPSERVKLTEHVDRPPDNGIVSTETGMTPTSRREILTDTSLSGKGPHWCSIAYWELRQRVGRLLTVFEPSINIFQLLPRGDGMCLQILQDDCTSETIRRTRDKIGFGIVLSREKDEVWAYNLSQFPVFVNSPTLDIPNSRMLCVYKVMPGYSLKIFDYEHAHVMKEIRDPKYFDGPYDPSCIRISFAKGWGPNYSRQFITSCPCWIEVLLNIDR